MSFQAILPRKVLPTCFASKWLFSCMSTDMFYQFRIGSTYIITKLATKSTRFQNRFFTIQARLSDAWWCFISKSTTDMTLSSSFANLQKKDNNSLK
jgi:hypothetical protein